MDGSVSRRRFLSLSAGAAAVAAVGGGAALAACGSSSTPGSSGSSATTRPRTAPAHRGRLSDVEHIVILFQENRSFDQIFGTRKGVRGFGDPKVLTGPGGRPIWYQPSATNPDGYVLPFAMTREGPGGQCGFDIDHGWEGQHVAWNKGAMDSFGRRMGAQAMGYYERGDLPWYYAVADEFTLCDRWHCSVLGPTNPNRYMAMTGTIDPAGRGGGPATDNSGKAYTWETYPERLQKAGVSWIVYHDVDDYDDNSLPYFRQFQSLPKTDPMWDAGIRTRTPADFAADCAADRLPQVSWIVAPERQSEHAVWAPAAGEAYTYQHVKAIMDNPKVWAKTAFILAYDENGGFFDHVPPPVPDPGTKDEFVQGEPIGLGMRVPGLVISPWTRGGKVDSHIYDHTSTLQLLEARFGVEAPLISAWRRETCGDLTTAFDFSSFDPSVPKLPDPTAVAATVTAACASGPRPAPPTPQSLPTIET